MTELRMDAPNEKQRRFLLDRHRHIAYGGARGGGKSWAVRTKAKLLALRYAGIKLLIVRRTLRELQNNHIDPLRQELADVAKYKAADKRFEFPNGSVLTFGYCVWGDRIFEKCGIRRDEGGDDGKTLEIRGKRRLSARDGGANYQQS